MKLLDATSGAIKGRVPKRPSALRPTDPASAFFLSSPPEPHPRLLMSRQTHRGSEPRFLSPHFLRRNFQDVRIVVVFRSAPSWRSSCVRCGVRHGQSAAQRGSPADRSSANSTTSSTRMTVAGSGDSPRLAWQRATCLKLLTPPRTSAAQPAAGCRATMHRRWPGKRLVPRNGTWR